jgi:hypothetical protein
MTDGTMRVAGRSRLLALGAARLGLLLTLSAVPAAVTGPASEASDTTHACTARLSAGSHGRDCAGVLVGAGTELLAEVERIGSHLASRYAPW